ncbi:sterol desaturase family protein [Paucibacter sp. O1-1]|nr:sterol desaturase family protein [Paucibacter sp. O1-1]MDA3824608.1 sterol desaturase family protein [Paucibacter sp. O1-1]
MLNPIVYAVPVFVLLMAAEFLWSRRRGEAVYRAADTVASLSAGISSQLAGVFTKLMTVGLYTLVWQHGALLEWPLDAVWAWLLALLLYDFLYYWNHRLGHEVAILWAAHVVHHSSEEYNLSTALRQTSTGFLFSWIFYLPMALLGVPPLMFVVVGLIDLLYQFWVHTRLVGKLGWFDRVFVSPSNHRVHHGQNDYCLDRNYGGILILWDQLFGTFVEEREGEPIVYGVLGPLRSWSVWQANTRNYAELWRDARLADNWRDKLTIWFRRPAWRPAAAERLAPKPRPDLARFVRYAPPLPPGLPLYGLLQLALLLLLGVYFLAVEPRLSLQLGLAAAAGLVLSLVLLARLLEDPAAAAGGERLRLLALGGVAGAQLWQGQVLLAPGSALWALSLLAALAGLALLPRLLRATATKKPSTGDSGSKELGQPL